MKAEKLIALMSDVEITAADAEHKGPRAFTANAYTGGALQLPNFHHPVVVDLASLQTRKSMIANLDHDRTKRVGNVQAHNDGKTLAFSGVASAVTAARDEVIQSADSGFSWQASIEASAGRSGKLEEIKAGKTAIVNGQKVTGPIYIARNWVAAGFAFVSLGADDDTSVSIAATAASLQGDKQMDKKFSDWLEAHNWNPEGLPEGKEAELKAKYELEINKPAPVAAPKKAIAEIVAEQERENLRVEQITELMAEKLSQFPNQLRSLEAMASAAIESKMSVQAFENQLLKEYAGDRPHLSSFQIKTRDNISDQVLAAAICQTGRLSNIEDKFDDRTLQAAHDQFKGNIGLNQIFHVVAKANGYRNANSATGVDKDVHNAAFKFDPELKAAFSTISLPGILSATANKFLLDGWGAGDMAWQSITSKRSVKNFQTHTSYRLSGTMKYSKVGAGGELTHGTVGEDTYTNKVDTYGKMFSITRNDLINDDLSALTSIPREMGFGANDAFNEVFYTEFLDNSSFFASGNSNVSTGGGSALAVAGLSAAELVFLAQTKPNGTPLGLMPSILFVPSALYRTALGLMASPVMVGTTTANTLLPSTNTFSGNYTVVTSPFLSNSAYTGYSAAAWYLLADPGRMSTIETAFLDGREAPVIESAEAAFNVLGVQMRAYHDFGCNLQEYRAGVRSNGS